MADAVDNITTAAAINGMNIADTEEMRRWLLTRYAQRILHHLELNLGSEVDKQAILAERGIR